jgi:hypothetical protein
LKTLVLVVVLVAVLVPGAIAAGRTLDPRVPTLQRQIGRLQANDQLLAAQLQTLRGQLEQKANAGCLGTIPMILRSNYFARYSDGSTIFRSALDATGPGDSATQVIHVVNNIC